MEYKALLEFISCVFLARCVESPRLFYLGYSVLLNINSINDVQVTRVMTAPLPAKRTFVLVGLLVLLLIILQCQSGF